MTSVRSKKIENTVTQPQVITSYLAHFFAFVVLVMTIIWIARENTDEKFLGGMNFSGKLFYIHPFCMVLGFAFFFTQDFVADRVYPFHPTYTRYLHFFFQTAAATSIAVGLYAVIENKNRNERANLIPFHSWLGLSAVCFYTIQYVFNIFIFHFNGLVTPIYRFALSPLCKFLTIFSYITGIFTIISGITNLNGRLSCSYEVTAPDYNPSSHFHLIPNGCKLSHFLGITLATLAFFTFYSSLDLRKSKFYAAFDNFFDEKVKIDEHEPLSAETKQEEANLSV